MNTDMADLRKIGEQEVLFNDKETNTPYFIAL